MAVDLASKFPSLATEQPRIIDGQFKYDLTTRERLALELPAKIHAQERVAQNTPLVALTSRLGGPAVKKQPVFYMFQIANLKNYVNTTGTQTASGTTIAVAAADVKYFKQGFHVLVARTREILRISSTPAASMPIARSRGTVAGTAIVSGDEMVILDFAGAEGDTRKSGLLRQPVMIFNYIAEWQDSYELTQYVEGVPYTGGGDPRRDARMDKLEQARMVLEKKAIWDQRAKYTDENGNTVYVPNALDAICTENEYDFEGSFTEPKLLAALEPIGRHGPSVRWGMSSPRFMRMVSQTFIGERRQNTEVIRMAGVNVVSYQAPGMRVNFFPHVLFQDSTKTDASAISGTCYICNLERGGDAPGFGMATMRSQLKGFFKWFLNLQTDGARKVIDQIVINYGFTYSFVEHFARLVNPGS